MGTRIGANWKHVFISLGLYFAPILVHISHGKILYFVFITSGLLHWIICLKIAFSGRGRNYIRLSFSSIFFLISETTDPILSRLVFFQQQKPCNLTFSVQSVFSFRCCHWLRFSLIFKEFRIWQSKLFRTEVLKILNWSHLSSVYQWFFMFWWIFSAIIWRMEQKRINLAELLFFSVWLYRRVRCLLSVISSKTIFNFPRYILVASFLNEFLS